MQAKELEDLAAAQQNSLEEAEERYRDLQQEHDELHHTALAAKAQLVTAQAQVCTGGLDSAGNTLQCSFCSSKGIHTYRA